MACRRDWALDVQAKEIERSELQMAIVDVFERLVRKDDGPDGQDLYREATQGEVKERADLRFEAALPAILAGRQRRLTGRICAPG